MSAGGTLLLVVLEEDPGEPLGVQLTHRLADGSSSVLRGQVMSVVRSESANSANAPWTGYWAIGIGASSAARN